MKKKSITIIVTILLLAALVFIGDSILKQGNKNKADSQNTNKPATEKVGVVNGTITAINRSTITVLLSDGKTSKDYQLTSKVAVTKLGKSSTGALTKLGASLTDLKVNSSVIIYSSDDLMSDEFPVLTEVTILSSK